MKTRAFWSVFAPVANALLRIRRKPRKSNWPSSEDRRALISDAATPIGVFFRRGGHGGGFGEYTPVCLGGSSCPTPCGSPMAGRFPGAGGRSPIRNGVGGIAAKSINCLLFGEARRSARRRTRPGRPVDIKTVENSPGNKATTNEARHDAARRSARLVSSYPSPVGLSLRLGVQTALRNV
jgi:hypothetical protein